MNNKHFLITLFNLQLWHVDKKKTTTLTEEWLAKRFQLFGEYCLPSVKRQTAKDFTWLCLMDINTPQVYKDRIEKYRWIVPQLKPCYFTKEQTEDWVEHLKEIIRPMVGDADYVMTTNLDNDDVLHKDMIGYLQKTLEQTGWTGLYTFTDGLQYFPKTGLLLKMNYPHNHFLTLVEDTQSDFKTIKSIRHATARKEIQGIVDIPQKPYWIEVVHDNNVNNDLRITSRIKYSMFWKGFGLEEYGLSIDRNWLQVYFCNLVIWPGLFLKTACRKLLRKLK